MDREALERIVAIGKTVTNRRKNDPLWAWNATPKQKPFIQSVLHNEARENWFIAANRCITPFSVMETGSSTRLALELIGEEDLYVLSWDGENLCKKPAFPLFLKGIEPALRIHLDNGEFFEATCKHRVLTLFGWLSLENLLSMPDDPCFHEKFSSSLGYCCTGNRLYDPQPPLDLDTGAGEFQPIDDVPPYNHLASGSMDVEEPTQEYIHACLASFQGSMPDDPHLIAALCALWKPRSYGTIDQR